jgi:hypothetical protein
MRLHLAAAAAMAVAVVACSAPRHGASDSAYITPRAEYARSLTARYQTEGRGVLHDDSLALRDLEQRLRPLIGPLAVAGFADSGRINLVTLLPGDEVSGLADGLVYQSGDQQTRMFVTTRGIFRAWIASRFAGMDSVPRDPLLALTRDEVYTFMFEIEAAVVRYADLPLTDPHRRVLAAMLVDRAQDICLTCAANTILLGVNVGNRIFVVDAPARDTIDIPRACSDAVAVADTQRMAMIDAAFATRRRSGQMDTSSIKHSLRAEEDEFADLRHCYATGIRSDPRFSHVMAQARELLEALPDR